MKAIINCWLITGALFCTMLSGLKAQPCPPQGDCDTAQWQGPIGTAFKIAAPSCSLQVNMMYRICNGVVEFYEVSRELIGICEAFEKRRVVHFDFDAAGGMAVQAGLQNIWEWIVQRGFYSGSVPPCSTGWGTPRAHYYTRRCGVWVYCEYAVDESVEKWCQQGFDPPFPEFRGPDGKLRVRSYKWQDCGTTCCKRVFEYCIETFPQFGDQVIRARQISKQRIYPCSLQESKYGTGPNSAQCEDGC